MLPIAMVAGETSGDLLGDAILHALFQKNPNITASGIGGEKMLAHPFSSRYPLSKLAVNGLFEVLAHYREIKGIHDELKDYLIANKPKVFVGIDAPEFNLSLESHLRQANIPTVHMVSPTIWAWRPGRIKKIQKAVSHMLVLFPFEVDIYKKAGVNVTFVGHPLAQSIPLDNDTTLAREKLGLIKDKSVVAILPGSRLSEIRHHTEIFIKAAQIIEKSNPSIQYVIPMAGERQKQTFLGILQEKKLHLQNMHITDDSHLAIASSDAVLVASGTATLEVALYRKPMVIAYYLMWATWQIAKHLVKPPVGLPNILAGEMIVPELLQYDATPEKLAKALDFQLTNEENRKKLQERFEEMHTILRKDTGDIAAQTILDEANYG